MTTKPQSELARSRAFLGRVKNGGVVVPETNYYRVAWHKKQKSWRVKVCRADDVFYKEFKDEHVAGWVADCAAILMYGPTRDGATDFELNFCWNDGIPLCPDRSITVLAVYKWLVDKKIETFLKPSELKK